MPFNSYAELQTSVLNWIARPSDPLVAPSVPDMITLFEREARRRLRVGDAEVRAYMTVNAAAVALPADCRELRLVTSHGYPLNYVTPMELSGGSGQPCQYTLHGRELRLGPGPSGNVQVEILYQSGVPPLSDAEPTNWLLQEHPDAYLYGTLANAEAFIGHDERIQLWLVAREAAFASIEQADRKARWPGALTIRPDFVSGAPATGNAWTVIPAASPPSVDVTLPGALPEGLGAPPAGCTMVNIRNGTGAPITITMPVNPVAGQCLRFKDALGNAGTYPIMLQPPASTIDGNPNFFLMSNFMAVELYWMGTQWGSR